MVKLSKIGLKGFKSFKNKTTLLIGEGVTCIAGTNGSGKSNVLDAFSFVLGKNSAKALRADKMEDLIFKSDSGHAESAKVELEIENKNRELKIDLDIISIERKVNSQGQSTYRLNGKIETRQRILDLLIEARISPDGLNIVAQGDVTRVLEMNPIERRQIIDDLAGLAEFDDKKKKSENELQKVDEILKEQDLLLREREKIFLNISDEKHKVETYHELNDKIKKINYSILKVNLDELNERKDTAVEKDNEISSKHSELDDRIKEIDELIEGKENEMKDLAQNIVRGSEEVEIISKQERLKSEIMKFENNFDSNEREKSRLLKLIEQVSEVERPQAVKFLLGKDGIIGTVESLINCEPKYKEAIDAALGNVKNDIVIDSFDKIPGYIKYLKDNKIGRAKFLPLDKLQGGVIGAPKVKGVIDVAINLVKYDQKYWNVIEYALGSTLVADKLESVKKIVNQYRISTVDGSLVERSGAVLGGYKKEKGFNTSKIETEIATLEEENKKFELKISELKAQLDEISKTRKETSTDYGGLGKKIEEKEAEIKKLREDRRKNYERKLRLQSEMSNEKIKLAKIETEIKNYNEKISGIEVFDEIEEGEPQELNAKLGSYTREINQLGILNFKAVEDYEKYRAEYENLKEKVEKIVEEKYSILKVINEIESRRKEKFMSLFNGVNNEFKEIYHGFTEGEGYITLEDPEDIYSGLLIKARPKGKRLLGIDSLSGGEKTVTAIGFLLAVQRCKPSCFVLLDEIDAALDRENTKKVIDIIKEFSKEQQFVIITHNDVTISQSNQVYGVVSENGISSIVGIKLNKKDQEA